MNKLTPYEEMLARRLRELPLPDEDMAWQDMKRRLDQRDDNGTFILPFKKGCGLLALLLAVFLIGLLWFYTSHDKNNLPVTEGLATERNTTDAKDTIQSSNKNPRQKVTAFNNDDSVTTSKQAIIDTWADSKRTVVSSKRGDDIKNKPVAITGRQATKGKKNYTRKSKFKYTTTGKAAMLIKKGEQESLDTGNDETNSEIQLSKKKPADSVARGQQEVLIPDATLPLQKDSVSTLKKTDTIAAENNKKQQKEKQPEKISYCAGLALWQRIDNIGPKTQGTLLPGNTGGTVNTPPKNNKLFDYVPSLYARIYKGNRWFLQTEFRYRAPQYERDLLYSQKPVAGPFGTITNTKIVTKIYYHQVPITFNYFIAPNWSAGAGVIWNKFSRAVTVEQIRAGIPGFPQQDSLLSTNFVIVSKADSNFTKYYFQGTIETQYRWRKFSLGVRYVAALQPYLLFTLPGGALQKEKSSSLQLFLRYEWWKSNKTGTAK
ncbi:MAG: hypothetical protein ABIN01_21020 [Ferruginibacter sp.]